MTATFVDSNVLLDIYTRDPDWAAWSAERIVAAATDGELWIVDVVYAEIAVRFPSPTVLDEFVSDFRLVVQRTDRAALYEAAKAHADYRRAGGTRSGVLPDFFIGA